MKVIEIKLDTETVVVGELPLGKYADLLKAIRELPKKIKGIEGVSNEELFDNLPVLLTEAFPEMVAILSLATGLEKKVIEELGLYSNVLLLEAVIEVNNYREIYDRIKKMTARPTQ